MIIVPLLSSRATTARVIFLICSSIDNFGIVRFVECQTMECHGMSEKDIPPLLITIFQDPVWRPRMSCFAHNPGMFRFLSWRTDRRATESSHLEAAVRNFEYLCIKKWFCSGSLSFAYLIPHSSFKVRSMYYKHLCKGTTRLSKRVGEIFGPVTQGRPCLTCNPPNWSCIWHHKGQITTTLQDLRQELVQGGKGTVLRLSRGNSCLY